MKTEFKILIACVCGFIVFWILFAIGTNNSLVRMKEDVRMQQGQVETQLQRRMDLIPNLVETVKAYAKHEEAVFTEIANARASLASGIGTDNLEQIAQANNQLDSALGRLIAISEAYPELKSDKNFINLQDELAGTENRISVARQYYNESVAEYNKKVQSFPSSIIANSKGFKTLPYFEAAAQAQSAPKVDFN